MPGGRTSVAAGPVGDEVAVSVGLTAEESEGIGVVSGGGEGQETGGKGEKQEELKRGIGIHFLVRLSGKERVCFFFLNIINK